METIQILKRENISEQLLAEKYYGILSIVNDLKLTEREIQLVAYTALRGNITFPNTRNEFCDVYKTTVPTISNIISKLKKKKIFIKENKLIKLNPIIVLDFKKNVKLEINLVWKSQKQ